MVVNHYSVVDESKDEVEEGESEEPCKCHCNCESEDMVTAVEAFILTAVGILVLSLTVYSCIALRFFILKRKKRNTEFNLKQTESSRKMRKKKNKKGGSYSKCFSLKLMNWGR